MESHWYVLYTAPRAEKKVEQRLRGEGDMVFLPLYKSKRKWSDRIKEVELPLLSSYIFVYCNEKRLRTMAVVPGVVKVVYYVGKPAIVKQEEIDALKEFITLTVGNQVVSEGDMVSILNGPLEKQAGKIIKLSGKHAAYLHIPAIGATIWVKLSEVEKIEED